MAADFEEAWEVGPTLDWLAARGACRAALQFPDALLGVALRVEAALRTGAAARGLGVQAR